MNRRRKIELMQLASLVLVVATAVCLGGATRYVLALEHEVEAHDPALLEERDRRIADLEGDVEEAHSRIDALIAERDLFSTAFADEADRNEALRQQLDEAVARLKTGTEP